MLYYFNFNYNELHVLTNRASFNKFMMGSLVFGSKCNPSQCDTLDAAFAIQKFVY